MKFKELFQKWILNNWKYKLMAIFFAFVLWMVIVNIQDPDFTKTITDIPVNTINVEAIDTGDYVYSIKSGETATIIVTGKKSIVSNLSASDFYATANFEELSMTNAIPIKITLTGSKSLYANDITITQQTTSMVLVLDTITSKSIPVKIKYSGAFAEDETLDEVVVEPAEIEVRAPKQTLDTIISVEATVNIDDVADGVTLRAAPVIYDYAGNIVTTSEEVTTNCSEVAVTFAVSNIKTVELRVGTAGTPASGYELAGVTTSFDSVVLKGSAEALEDVSYIKIPNSRVSIAGADEDVEVKVDVTEYLPDGVEIYDNNINVVITAVIQEKETETTTEEETESDEKTSDESDDSKETTEAGGSGDDTKETSETEETAEAGR